MLGLVVTIAVVLSGFWVYFDATSNKIGKIPDAKGAFNMSAGGWAAVTLGLWIIAFPAYVLKRSALIAVAQKSPVGTKSRARGFLVLGAVGLFFIAAAWAGHRGAVPSACDSREVAGILQGIPPVKAAISGGASLGGFGEASYDFQAEKRLCRAILRKDGRKQPLMCSVSWGDKSAGRIWVQVER